VLFRNLPAGTDEYHDTPQDVMHVLPRMATDGRTKLECDLSTLVRSKPIKFVGRKEGGRGVLNRFPAYK
jgi:hypothetical protein